MERYLQLFYYAYLRLECSDSIINSNNIFNLIKEGKDEKDIINLKRILGSADLILATELLIRSIVLYDKNKNGIEIKEEDYFKPYHNIKKLIKKEEINHILFKYGLNEFIKNWQNCTGCNFYDFLPNTGDYNNIRFVDCDNGKISIDKINLCSHLCKFLFEKADSLYNNNNNNVSNIC